MSIVGIQSSRPAPLKFFLLLVINMVWYFGKVLHGPAVLLYKWEFGISMVGGIWALLTPGGQSYLHLCEKIESDSINFVTLFVVTGDVSAYIPL